MKRRGAWFLVVAALLLTVLIVVQHWDHGHAPRDSDIPEQFSDTGDVAFRDDRVDAERAMAADADNEHPAEGVACTPGEELTDIEFPEGLTELELENAAEFLMGSPDPQHKLAGALLTAGDGWWELRRERFGVALEANRKDPVMLSLAFAECRRKSFDGWCEGHGVEKLLIAADPNNGESWAIIADRRLANGDLDGGLAAMETAAASPVANAYFEELLGVVDRGLAAAGVGDISVRFMTAMGIAVVKIRGYGIVMKTCEEESAIDYRWRSACMSFGKKLEQQARTQIDAIMGMGLQRAVLAAEGDGEGLRELKSRRDRQRNLMFQSAKHGFHKVLFSDVRMLSRYINELMTKSEYDAEVYLVDEQRKWLESQCIHINVDPETDSQEYRE